MNNCAFLVVFGFCNCFDVIKNIFCSSSGSIVPTITFPAYRPAAFVVSSIDVHMFFFPISFWIWSRTCLCHSPKQVFLKVDLPGTLCWAYFCRKVRILPFSSFQSGMSASTDALRRSIANCDLWEDNSKQLFSHKESMSFSIFYLSQIYVWMFPSVELQNTSRSLWTFQNKRLCQCRKHPSRTLSRNF